MYSVSMYVTAPLFGWAVLRRSKAPALASAAAPYKPLSALTADRQLRFLYDFSRASLRGGPTAQFAHHQETSTCRSPACCTARACSNSRAFPTTEVLGPAASEEEIKALIDKYGLIFVKPVFKGGIGKKGKAGLLGRAKDLKTALAEKERLYFAEHPVGHVKAKANGVTFEAGVPAKHEVYFSISDSTRFRAPTMTLTHMGGMDIEELDKCQVAMVPFDPLTGLKAFVVANALTEIGAPKEIISPLVQQLPKLWELFHDFGMTTLELNPIRMREDKKGRLTPVACDFKCGFDRDDPRWLRLGLPPHLFAADYSDFEQEINTLRTHQGQSDVYVINDRGTVLAPTFGGGANSLVTEMLGDAAIITSDFGGNPPYEKMKEVARICFRHWLSRPTCCS